MNVNNGVKSVTITEVILLSGCFLLHLKVPYFAKFTEVVQGKKILVLEHTVGPHCDVKKGTETSHL